MKYNVELSPRARTELSGLTRRAAEKMSERIDWLAENADTIRHQSLTGQYSGSFRLRSGDYRAIYDLDRTNRLISVRTIGHRREVYD